MEMELDQKVEKILADAKKRLQNMDWLKRYGSYFEALLCECAKDTLSLIEQQRKRIKH
jgi:hypothetical protein